MSGTHNQALRASLEHERKMPFWRFVGIPILCGSFGMVVMMAVAWFLERGQDIAFQKGIKAAVARDLAAIRGSAEIAINQRIHVLEGIRAYASINPEMTRRQFADLSANVMNNTEGIRSVTSIKDNIINDVYPLEGNEGAIGIDLLKHPEQRTNAEHAIATGKPWLAGPIKLAQGGEAFIHRAPVFVTNPGGIPGGGPYWGMVSMVIDKNALNENILESVPDGLKIAIRNRNSRNEPGEIFLGNSSIFELSPIETKITLPTGSWNLYGVPGNGWPTKSPSSTQIRAVGACVSLCVGIIVFLIFRTTSRYRELASELVVANKEAIESKTLAEHSTQRAVEKAESLKTYSRQLEESQQASLNMMEDIEEARRQLEASNDAIIKSNEELEQFAYIASHDLQEPLRKVSSFCQLLDEHLGDSLDEEAKQYLEFIVDGATRMRTLTQDLLRYSRIQSEGADLLATDSSESLAEAIYNLEGAIEESDASVTFDSMPTVFADNRQLVQLFQNLIGNGIKYRRDARPDIHVSATDDGSRWIFSVKDNGIGIDPKYHERVFGIFKRLHARSEYSGTGIGLAICKRIAERLNGKIWLESNKQDGSTFFFTIPKMLVT